MMGGGLVGGVGSWRANARDAPAILSNAARLNRKPRNKRARAIYLVPLDTGLHQATGAADFRVIAHVCDAAPQREAEKERGHRVNDRLSPISR
jgi:hypothetical protein